MQNHPKLKSEVIISQSNWPNQMVDKECAQSPNQQLIWKQFRRLELTLLELMISFKENIYDNHHHQVRIIVQCIEYLEVTQANPAWMWDSQIPEVQNRKGTEGGLGSTKSKCQLGIWLMKRQNISAHPPIYPEIIPRLLQSPNKKKEENETFIVFKLTHPPKM